MAESQFEKLIATMPFGLDRILLRILSFHNGREHAIGRGEVVQALKSHGFDVDERQAREAIHDLRRKGNLICSAPGKGGGYYLAESHKDVREFFKRELHPKAMDLLETEKAMREAAKQKFGEAIQEELWEE